MNKYFIYIIIFLIFISPLFAQEQLKSVEEDYYDFLTLQGITERPTLAYRTMSDSVWKIKEEAEHPWQEQNIGRFIPLFGDFKMRVYGPDLFMSYNTANPYGQNDGVLWQGKGFNTLLKGGVRFDGYGLEITLLPHLAFSQNQYFKIIPSVYNNEFGYFRGIGPLAGTYAGADAPQRFGDKSFFDWDFGDTELRYTWKTLTIGFGSQAIWLGPSNINSMFLSNNAPAYPKFDFGLRKTPINISGKYIGDIEVRFWTGRLTESDYFDDIPENDYTMMHGLSFAYSPSFIPGFTIFANRLCLIEWDWKNLKYIIPMYENTTEDQKFSIGITWMFNKIGLELYSDFGLDDTVINGFPLGYMRYPLHTLMFTVGLKKVINVSKEKNMYGILYLECNWMEMSQNLQLKNPDSVYFHGIVIHGHTNRGQWLGAGTGWAGNVQHIGFRLFYPKGSSYFFIQRDNPDNDYLYWKAVYASALDNDRELHSLYMNNFKGNFSLGVSTNYFLINNLNIGAGFVYNLIINPYYYHFKDNSAGWNIDYMHNFSFQLSLKYYL